MTIDEPHEDQSFSMYNYLKDAAAAGELIRIEKGALPEHANVPLVIYLGGERKVVGEAVIEGDVIKGVFGPELGQDVLDQLFGPHSVGLSFTRDLSLAPPFESETAVLEEMLDKPIYKKPLVITNCPCPWNNGYYPPELWKSGHHVSCPFLKGEHSPEDDCGPLGHKDKEGEDGSA